MTATFVPQDGTNFTAIRYYTQFDPYFYSVDNRPLQDIETNLSNMRTLGGDSSRRAVMINAIASAISYARVFPDVKNGRVADGLKITSPSTNTLRIAQGSTYEYKATSDTITTNVVKQAIFFGTQDFTFTPPATAGQSLVYTIEGTYTEFTAATMPTSGVPYVDSSNTYLPSTLLNAELKLSLNSTGVPATTGTEQPPTTTAGTFPIYNVTFINGTALPVIKVHANGPTFRGLSLVPDVEPHTTNGATSSILQDAVAFTFADAVTNSIVIPLTLDSSTVNPYKPITLKLTWSPSVTAGNFSMQLAYKASTSNDLITTARVSTSIEVVPVTAVGDAIQSNTLVTAIIPNTEFAGFSSGTWGLIKDRMTIVLSRLGADVNDTNTGTLRLFEVKVLQ